MIITVPHDFLFERRIYNRLLRTSWLLVVLVVLKASTRPILHGPNHAKDYFPEKSEHQFPFAAFRREKKYYV